MYTTALPIGRPHEDTGLVEDVPARSCSPATDSICRPFNSARSPRGFHVNGPGAGAGKTQDAAPVSGSSVQAFPPATNATVCARVFAPTGHPPGSGCPSAKVVVTPEGDGEPVRGRLGEGDGACVDAPVHAAS